MIRINTLDRCGETLTIELMGYIHKTEFAILHDCLQGYAEAGVTEVCIRGAARLLGMKPERLRSRLRVYGLRRPKKSS